jgi:hypothetical protein
MEKRGHRGHREERGDDIAGERDNEKNERKKL